MAAAVTDPPLVFTVEGLVYTLDRPPSRLGRKCVVTVRADGAPPERAPLVDRVDLYAFRSRRALAGLVADAFGRQRSDVLGALALVLDEVERTQAGAAAERAAAPEALSAERRRRAEALLARPDLLDRAAAAMEALGYVGEPQTKRLAYLVATSRLLRRPLSAILLAPSGCGKSELLEVVAKLLPPEAVEFLSRLTPQALYYAGPEHLRHKLVLVDETAGTTEADYAVRTLQTKGFLSLAVPVQGRTERCEAHGPIALMSGTTSTQLNPENLSRCLLLSLDPSPEQTLRIQAAQRAAWAGAQREVCCEPWQDAQRLLEPADVVIPFAERLSFPARTTHDRRGNQKLLALVAAHALLHQRQRRRDRAGRLLATPADYRAVHALLEPLVQAELDGLSPRAARLYRVLSGGREAPGEVTRRGAAALLDGSYNTAKRALEELLAQELVALVDPGPPRRYRLLAASALGAPGGLTAPRALARRRA